MLTPIVREICPSAASPSARPLRTAPPSPALAARELGAVREASRLRACTGSGHRPTGHTRYGWR
jgi:hypothetical protein